MWFIVKILWTNYMWFIVKILWTWNLFFTLLEISKPLFFFFSIFGNVITTIAKKKFYSPISAMTLPPLPFFKIILRALHTRAHSDTQHSGRKTGQWNFGNGIDEIQHFLSPPFLILSPAFWLNFGNPIAEIQSLSSISQLTSNRSYNAN